MFWSINSPPEQTTLILEAFPHKPEFSGLWPFSPFSCALQTGGQLLEMLWPKKSQTFSWLLTKRICPPRSHSTQFCLPAYSIVPQSGWFRLSSQPFKPPRCSHAELLLSPPSLSAGFLIPAWMLSSVITELCFAVCRLFFLVPFEY